MMVVAVISFLTATFTLYGEATISVGENAREFGVLCTVMRWTATTFSNAAEPWDDDKTYNEIAVLNMTLADKTWRQSFLKPGKDDEWETSLPTKYGDNAVFKKRWEEWAKAAQTVGKESELKNKLTAIQADKVSAEELSRRAVEVATITEQARAIHQQLKLLNRKERKATPTTISQKIKTAVLGKKDGALGTDPKVADSVTSGGSTVANRGTGCKATSLTTNPGLNLGTVALCLCANGGSGTAVTNACWTATGQNVAYPTGADTTASAIQSIIKHCGTIDKVTLTSAMVAKAVQDLQGLFTVGSGGAFIGAYLTTGCDGNNNGGLCFDYVPITTSRTAKLTDIKWMQELTGLYNDLASDELNEAQGAPLQSQLTALQKQAAAASAGETATKQTHVLIRANNEAKKEVSSKEANITETDATCEKRGEEDNCKEGCKWDSDGGNKKCVVDQNYKPPQAEGGEKDSKTGTTNTTGSNSFVINKAPLFLAFLLF
uniref:Variant surface glycoprotein 551 n=1 Tax=Trypanosoma brucei TaxID=5691 RepID=M4SYC7_9TRYP|nr:variant surface glycoprotein 551 [Trypanosoma brucei]